MTGSLCCTTETNSIVKQECSYKINEKKTRKRTERVSWDGVMKAEDETWEGPST